MNDTPARLAYEDWCRYRRKRKSQAGWELWAAAYEAGYHSMPTEFREITELPERKRAWVMATLKSVLDIANDRGGQFPPMPSR